METKRKSTSGERPEPMENTKRQKESLKRASRQEEEAKSTDNPGVLHQDISICRPTHTHTKTPTGQ